MSHPLEDIADILSTLSESQLLDQIDVDDIDNLDVDVDTDVRNIRDNTSTSGKRSPRRRGRSRGNRRNNNRERSGKEKFEAKRKIKKINRKIKEAERKGYDLTDGFQTDTNADNDAGSDNDNTDDVSPCVSWYDSDTDETVTAVVERTDACIEFEAVADGATTLARVTFDGDDVDATSSHELDMTDPDVETDVTGDWITEFTITPGESESEADTETDE